jgi:hypothetical protein
MSMQEANVFISARNAVYCGYICSYRTAALVADPEACFFL